MLQKTQVIQILLSLRWDNAIELADAMYGRGYDRVSIFAAANSFSRDESGVANAVYAIPIKDQDYESAIAGINQIRGNAVIDGKQKMLTSSDVSGPDAVQNEVALGGGGYDQKILHAVKINESPVAKDLQKKAPRVVVQAQEAVEMDKMGRALNEYFDEDKRPFQRALEEFSNEERIILFDKLLEQGSSREDIKAALSRTQQQEFDRLVVAAPPLEESPLPKNVKTAQEIFMQVLDDTSNNDSKGRLLTCLANMKSVETNLLFNKLHEIGYQDKQILSAFPPVMKGTIQTTLNSLREKDYKKQIKLPDLGELAREVLKNPSLIEDRANITERDEAAAALRVVEEADRSHAKEGGAKNPVGSVGIDAHVMDMAKASLKSFIEDNNNGKEFLQANIPLMSEKQKEELISLAYEAINSNPEKGANIASLFPEEDRNSLRDYTKGVEDARAYEALKVVVRAEALRNVQVNKIRDALSKPPLKGRKNLTKYADLLAREENKSTSLEKIAEQINDAPWAAIGKKLTGRATDAELFRKILENVGKNNNPLEGISSGLVFNAKIDKPKGRWGHL